MSTFDTLIAELECPETRRTVENPIQIFFRDCFRDKTYHVGDLLDNLPPEYNTTTPGYKLFIYAKTAHQKQKAGMGLLSG